MKIESVEVIPMSKESKWEDIRTPFEVSFITTSFDEWYAQTLKNREATGALENGEKMDDACIAFAKAQQGFMLSPTGRFGQTLYVAKAKAVENLDGIIIDGPLYQVTNVVMFDLTGHRKNMYKVRYGVSLI